MMQTKRNGCESHATRTTTLGSFERLEHRRLLSASFVDGHLTVTGTSGHDNLTLVLKEGEVVALVNDDAYSFPVTDVATGLLSVTMSGLDGDDVLRVQDRYGLLPVGVTFFGDGGNDMLMGSVHDDVLVGGRGDDILVAYGGNDQLFGGAGTDGLYGGDGDDVLHGGRGVDAIFGDGGRDVFNKADARGGGEVQDLTDEDVIRRVARFVR